MDWKNVIAALVPALMLLACERTQPPREAEAGPAPDTNAGIEAVAPPGSAPVPGANSTNDGNPDLTPPELVPQAERGVEGARNLLLSFARAIELKEYGQAWDLLGPADQRKWSRTAFAGIFADLGRTSVAIPAGMMEGAAGSTYYTAPVAITGSDREGRPVRIEGKAVLRRVNDVEGATPAQLRWHFETLTLDPTH